jgi:hypothetical protein
MRERAPILHHQRRAAEPGVDAEATEFGLALQFRDHARHRQEHRRPFVHFPQPVEAHPDQEHDEWLIARRCPAAGA